MQLSGAEREGLDDGDTDTGGIPPPDDAVDERGVALRHLDLKLQTRLTPDGLHKRLFDVWYDARSMEEEQGANVLFLALGLLRWFDSDSSDVARHAPLILVPVELERSTAADRFKLKWRSEPPSPNLTLQAKLKAEFGLILEDFQDEDALDLPAYFDRVAQTVSKQSRWEVLPDAMVLGFFSFAKFLMYRDLDPDCWPKEGGVDGHPLVTALLRDGFPESDPLVADGEHIDAAIPPLALNHVVDADSSQAVAIAEAAGGRTLVVKGPPGTGKSQTITNIIAASAAQGKKVLFVAEKRAALEVVWRRLQQVGLGPLTLELHSNKINKRTVLEELRRTRDAQPKPPRGDDTVIAKLGETTEELNAFAKRLHTPLAPSGLTPHKVIGRLVHAAQTEAPGGYELQGSAGWTAQEVDARRRLLSDFADQLAHLGSAATHPWRGVGCEPIDPMQRESIGRRIQSLIAMLTQARSLAEAAAPLGAPPATTLKALEEARRRLAAAAALPAETDRSALAHAHWRDGSQAPSRLIEAGEARAAAMAAVASDINDAGLIADLGPIRTAVVTKGGGLFRFLDGNYRAQIALLRSYLKTSLPEGVAARTALIDRVLAAQNARSAFDKLAPEGSAFGKAWKGEDSDWAVLRRLTAWREDLTASGDLCTSVATADGWPSILEAARNIAGALPQLIAEILALLDTLALNVPRAFGVEHIEDVPLDALLARLSFWSAELEALTRFIAFAACGRRASAQGLNSLVEAAHDGRLSERQLRPAFERAYAETLRTVLFESWPELRAFDGHGRNRLVDWFRQLDRTRIELAKEQIAARHAAERPKGAAGIGPLGVLNAELAKRARFKPVRKLLDEAGPAIQQLKPVFMMSPLSVAQYLKPGGLSFDLLVMDEASQIEPVDALGAIARVRQIVVVGDERQLPPTAFFKKLTGDVDETEDDDGVTIQAKDAESILDLCLAKGAPHRMLNWHYRSKHQSLIAVSNKEFYENRLFIVPSPYDAIAGMGLKFQLLQDAPYERGTSRTNPTEARIVAEAVIRHARETPGLSLGVATFSVAQRTAVLNALELLRRANPDVEEFFAAGGAEPFFVKNLENIQGDERDVILISVGYGKTAEGYLAHNFGPLSGEGGERRLNVLISRAKVRCQVFCNFTGADIDPERSRARGVMALKMFLTFAETGKFGLGEETGLDHDSDFEAQVAERLRALGYDVKAQIGASGFRVDLAISDPEKPGRFVLGIECDGAQYHSSRSARDRDRLRQQVLEAHGWIIHRIWSADWYLRPNEELKKVEDAIAAARAEWRERDSETVQRSQAVPLSFDAGAEALVATVGEMPAPAFPSAPTRVPYREAHFAVNTAVEPHEAPVAEMAAYVTKVVEAEGPVHLDEVTARIRTLWGLQRAGGRIRAAVARGADIARRHGLIIGEEFLSLPGQEVIVRDRSRVASNTLRKPEMLPPAEVDAALLEIVTANFGAKREDLPQEAARAFGFAATSAQLRSVFDAGIERLLATKALDERDGLLVRA